MKNLYYKNVCSSLAIAVACITAAPTQAETVLKANDGTFSLTGELLGIDDNAYRILTSDGELFVRKEFVTCEGDGCPEVETAEIEDSGEVVLRSVDGRIELTGNLVDFTANEFIIDTEAGQLSVRREFTSCEGTACPEAGVVSDRFSISVAGVDGANLLATIVGDYAASKDFNLTQQLGSADAMPTLLVGNQRGLEIARVEMVKMDTLPAINALVAGENQFAITRERASASELSAVFGTEVRDVSQVLNEEVIGLDAISFVVSKSNGIDVIDFGSARAIIDGTITNWSQLGGADQPITVHTLASNDAVVSQLSERGLAGANAMADTMAHSNADAFNAALDADSTGFGIIYRSQADGVKALNLATACNIFIDNSDFAIQTEEHPLTLRWYQYTLKGDVDSEFARNVGQFIPTDFGQAAIASRGLVTQQLQIVPMQDQGSRLLTTVLAGTGDRVSNSVMRSYFDEASNARRISTSLRFLSGNATLDSKADSDIDRISEIVRSNEYEGYEVLVFGFSDSYGDLSSNLSLSERRANSVKTVLLEKNPGYLDRNTVQSFGIGPIAPVGCNETLEGREQNRRVEIWIRPRA